MTDTEIRAIVSELLDIIRENQARYSRNLELSVGQLVRADGVLAERIGKLEQILATISPGNSTYDTFRAVREAGLAPAELARKVYQLPPERPPLWRRVLSFIWSPAKSRAKSPK